MPAPVFWLAIYLSAGALVFWACHNSPSCLLKSRLERNRRIAAGMLSAPVSRPAKDLESVSDGDSVR